MGRGGLLFADALPKYNPGETCGRSGRYGPGCATRRWIHQHLLHCELPFERHVRSVLIADDGTSHQVVEPGKRWTDLAYVYSPPLILYRLSRVF